MLAAHAQLLAATAGAVDDRLVILVLVLAIVSGKSPANVGLATKGESIGGRLVKTDGPHVKNVPWFADAEVVIGGTLH